MNMEDDLDLRRFKTLKMRFDVLVREIHDIHEEWKEHNEAYPDTYHQRRNNELITHESEVLKEIQELISSAGELMLHNLERPR